jgi:hypothetical protein
MITGNEPATGYGSDSYDCPGLTIRQRFAMEAMNGLCATHDSEGTWKHDSELVAKASVEYADALIKTLNETKP